MGNTSSFSGRKLPRITLPKASNGAAIKAGKIVHPDFELWCGKELLFTGAVAKQPGWKEVPKKFNIHGYTKEMLIKFRLLRFVRPHEHAIIPQDLEPFLHSMPDRFKAGGRCLHYPPPPPQKPKAVLQRGRTTKRDKKASVDDCGGSEDEHLLN
ncbi:hypothetical protein SEMRO_995_G229120.1 [Seminavis robusta]|uniref:Uncharacterized protein n=1 Tax=Seminavis robusta TaxID=568900 RepID=A0A9N8EFB5_9STRA|nr:hypothetical protein SEMRO_995_G229120.1 [Seminavis robusta]|eukprot:Sro995_g229120.1 n/a (154) ;mRNA; r:2467-2928